jgi:hypothetical protein
MKLQNSGKKARSKTAGNVNASPKREFVPSASVLGESEKNQRVPIEIGVDVVPHRLDLALKIADSVQCLSKALLQLGDPFGH